MRVLAFLLAMMILLLISLTLKAEVNFKYKRIEEADDIEIDFRAFHGIWHFRFKIPTLQLEWEKGPQVEVEQVAIAKGGTRKSTIVTRIRYLRRGWLIRFWLKVPSLLRAINRLKRQFYSGIHCKAINWRIEIGYKDAAATAIVAGTFWTMLSYTLARLYQQVTVDVRAPQLVVVPQFKKVGFLCDLQCIFQVRFGHIIFVGFNMLRTIIRGMRG
ncbi:MAG TPA: DUF2953 domain-containing protein [Desulfosporosinus sp.]|nr:DUF2953 domain-containing protein [Desulfosporosinus sp.]